MTLSLAILDALARSLGRAGGGAVGFRAPGGGSGR